MSVELFTVTVGKPSNDLSARFAWRERGKVAHSIVVYENALAVFDSHIPKNIREEVDARMRRGQFTRSNIIIFPKRNKREVL